MALLPSDKVEWTDIDPEERDTWKSSEGTPYLLDRVAHVGERRPSGSLQHRAKRQKAFREWRTQVEAELARLLDVPEDWRETAARDLETEPDEFEEFPVYRGTLAKWLHHVPWNRWAEQWGPRVDRLLAERREERKEWGVTDDALMIVATQGGGFDYEELWKARRAVEGLTTMRGKARQRERLYALLLEQAREETAMLDRQIERVLPQSYLTSMYWRRSLKVEEVAEFFRVGKAKVSKVALWEHTEARCPTCGLYFLVTANTRTEADRLLANPPCGCRLDGRDRDVAQEVSSYVVTEPRAGTMTVLELRNLAHDDYDEYLRTEHWQATRRAAHGHYGSECNRCSATKRLDVHHVTYDRVGCERVEDLEILCRDCHEKHHEVEARPDPVVIVPS